LQQLYYTPNLFVVKIKNQFLLIYTKN